ncbi:MAG: carboxypeptidase-like regulatory domain-containing protein [Bacteroidota bacterium]
MKVLLFARLLIGLLFLTCMFDIGSAQNVSEQILKGQVIDQNSRLPISYANIYNQTSGKGTISDVEGKFEITLSQLPSSLEISFIGYETKKIQIEARKSNRLLIELSKSSITLPEITVSATPKIEAISEEKFSIKDYLPFNDKLLIIKDYDSFNQDILSLTNLDGEEISQLSLKEMNGIIGLHQGCLGGLYVITDSEAHEIGFDADSQLQFTRTISKKKVENLLLPCVESSPTHIYFQDYLHEGQMVILSGAKRNERGNFVIRRISDVNNIKLYYSQVQRLNPNISAATVENSDQLKAIRGKEHEYYSLLHLFYQPLYIPIVDTGNKLCVFNHFEKQAEFYTYSGQLQHTLPLSYIEERKWDQPILNDKVSGATYIVFDNSRGKVLRKFSYQDASLAAGIPIKSQFVENMKMHNDVLYYLEREGRSTSRVLKKVVLKL